jgi:hypothetical protein
VHRPPARSCVQPSNPTRAISGRRDRLHRPSRLLGQPTQIARSQPPHCACCRGRRAARSRRSRGARGMRDPAQRCRVQPRDVLRAALCVRLDQRPAKLLAHPTRRRPTQDPSSGGLPLARLQRPHGHQYRRDEQKDLRKRRSGAAPAAGQVRRMTAEPGLQRLTRLTRSLRVPSWAGSVSRKRLFASSRKVAR